MLCSGWDDTRSKVRLVILGKGKDHESRLL
jgi:hypothetical protein